MQAFKMSLSIMTLLVSSHLSCSNSNQANSDKKPNPLSYQAQPEEPQRSDFEAVAKQNSSPSKSVLIENVGILTATGTSIKKGFLLIENGLIKDLGEGTSKVQAELVIDGTGKYVTPGIIDTHSHLGVYPMPEVKAHSDGNEATQPSTASVWSEHSFWPQDPGIWRALSGGVTTIQVLPGSANLIGGRTVTLYTTPGTSVTDMKFPEAPQGLKMACGENPKRVYGDKGGPSTRMGNIAGFRQEFQKAWEYRQELTRYQRDLEFWQERLAKIDADDDEARRELGDPPKAPGRDHGLDTLAKAMNGEILVHIHCYRADEMAWMLDLAQTYGFKIRSFHHALEAYKIRERLAKEDVSVSTWADWWGFKMEAFDGVPQNAAMVHQAGGRAIIHSDSAEDIRFLNLEAAKAQTAGKALGISISDEDALRWVTLNPAWALGIDDKVGSIEKGKFADLVLWDGHPFSSFTKTEKVFIRGQVAFDRKSPFEVPSDFEKGLGLVDQEEQQIKSDGVSKLDTPKLTPVVEALAKLPEKVSNSFVIQDVWLEKGNGERIEKGSVWVENDSIKAVGPVGKLEFPESVQVIDGRGMLLTPGFIEIQSELGLLLVEMERQAQDHAAGNGMNPGFEAIDGFDPFSIRIPLAREHGLTSVLIRPTGGMISGLGTVVDLRQSKEAFEQNIGQFMFAHVRSSDGNRGAFWLKLREAIDDTELYVKSLKSDRKQVLTHQLSLKPVHLEALSGVLKGTTPLFLELHRVSDVYAALRLKQDLNQKGYPIKLILTGASEAWLARAELAKAGVPVVITPTRQMPMSLDQLRVRDDNATLLAEAGVKVILSTNDVNVRRLRQQAGRAVAYGLPYATAMKAITGEVAEVLGLSHRGVIEPKRRADLVLWDGDPFEPQSSVVKLWIAGREQSLKNRQLILSSSYHKRSVAH